MMQHLMKINICVAKENIEQKEEWIQNALQSAKKLKLKKGWTII